jgi:hypothetical protein
MNPIQYPTPYFRTGMIRNPYDRDSCTTCRMCYRANSLQCEDACRMCGVAMFSEDTVNVYPSRMYLNYPRVSMFSNPSLYPYANYYGGFGNPYLNYW